MTLFFVEIIYVKVFQWRGKPCRWHHQSHWVTEVFGVQWSSVADSRLDAEIFQSWTRLVDGPTPRRTCGPCVLVCAALHRDSWSGGPHIPPPRRAPQTRFLLWGRPPLLFCHQADIWKRKWNMRDGESWGVRGLFFFFDVKKAAERNKRWTATNYCTVHRSDCFIQRISTHLKIHWYQDSGSNLTYKITSTQVPGPLLWSLDPSPSHLTSPLVTGPLP